MPMDSRVEGFETRAFGFIEEELAELRFTGSSEGFCKATVIVPGRLPQKRMTPKKARSGGGRGKR
jgi:hypothetical protein